jgi:3-dehydroquinate synthase
MVAARAEDDAPDQRGAGVVPAPADVWDQRFAVSFAYPVVFTHDLAAPDNPSLAWSVSRLDPTRSHRALAVIDEGVARAWPDLPSRLEAYAQTHAHALQWVGPPEIVPGGEAAKNDPRLVDRLHARFQATHLDRHAYVVAIGGGAVLDLVGYAAATAHRGLRLVRVPTTVLAQNDAGIGVKNGINAFGVKNFRGTFAPPWAVIDDALLLRTLQARDRTAGIAEAIKVAAIRDAAFFTWLESHVDALARGDEAAIGTMVRRCAELHLAHIRGSGDPFETGSARPLDFGHWVAHKLEQLTDHALRHGEAVAIGIVLDTRYSVASGRLDAAAGERVFQLVRGVGLPTWHPALAAEHPDGRPRALDGLQEFREHLGGELTLTMLGGIGHGVEIHEVDEARMRAAMAWLARRTEP